MAFMRHNNNGRRHNNNFHRNRNNSGGGNNQQQGGQRRQNRVNQVFESNGPDGRIRGTAQQIVEKYSTLARDAAGSGDKVLSLNYLQHAEHYQRLWNEIMEENAVFEREREQFRQQQQAQQAETGDAGVFAQQGDQPQVQPQNTDQDENALPNFLQVPITSGQGEQSQESRQGNRPHRQRRPNNPGSTAPAEKSEEN